MSNGPLIVKGILPDGAGEDLVKNSKPVLFGSEQYMNFDKDKTALQAEDAKESEELEK